MKPNIGSLKAKIASLQEQIGDADFKILQLEVERKKLFTEEDLAIMLKKARETYKEEFKEELRIMLIKIMSTIEWLGFKIS